VTTMRGVVAALGGGLVATAVPASAQVGYRPAGSPYTDLEYRQEWTLYAGQYSAGKDPAGVAPQAGPLVGLRYDLRLGGPAYLTAKFASVLSQRTVLDPKQPPATRNVGSQSWPIYLADIGISLNLTGFKAWHHLVPVLNGGLGIAGDFKGSRDVGQYQFGTPFALSLGAGVKWVPTSSRWQLRADVDDHFYQIRYPNTYYQSEGGAAAILPPSQAKNFWKSNPSLTVGVSYLFFR